MYVVTIHRSLRLLFSGNKRDRIETLTQCAECYKIAVFRYFLQFEALS